jgi:hypothetical protein
VAQRFERRHRRQPDATGADHDNWFVAGQRQHLVDGAVGGQPRTCHRGRPGRVQPGDVDEVFGIRDEDPVGVPAVPCHAEVLPGGAVVVPSRFALVAGSAADPRVDQPDVTDADTADVGTDLFDDPDHLVAHHQRVGDASIGKAESASAAEIVAAVA